MSPKTISEWSRSWLAPAKTGRGLFADRLAHELYIQNRVVPQFVKSEEAEEGETMTGAKLRYEIARANKAELQAAQLRGELIERSEAIQWVVSLVAEAKTAFLAMPRRLAPALYGREIRDLEARIREEIHRILGKLSRPTKKAHRKKAARKKGERRTSA